MYRLKNDYFILYDIILLPFLGGMCQVTDGTDLDPTDYSVEAAQYQHI